MQNKTLAADYLRRAGARLAALDVLYEHESWADVVRESQEIVELTLKAFLRNSGVEVPRIHDVGPLLKEHSDVLSDRVKKRDVDRMAKISHDLRRDRELSFYGSEDLTPGDFYQEADATEARDSARWVVSAVRAASNAES